MRTSLAFVLVASFLLAACAGQQPAQSPVRSCDDGGDGGVLIDGVCL